MRAHSSAAPKTWRRRRSLRAAPRWRRARQRTRFGPWAPCCSAARWSKTLRGAHRAAASVGRRACIAQSEGLRPASRLAPRARRTHLRLDARGTVSAHARRGDGPKRVWKGGARRKWRGRDFRIAASSQRKHSTFCRREKLKKRESGAPSAEAALAGRLCAVVEVHLRAVRQAAEEAARVAQERRWEATEHQALQAVARQSDAIQRRHLHAGAVAHRERAQRGQVPQARKHPAARSFSNGHQAQHTRAQHTLPCLPAQRSPRTTRTARPARACAC